MKIKESFLFLKKYKYYCFFILIDIVLIILHLIYGNQYDFFNLDKEYNLPSAWSSLQLIFISLVFLFTDLNENVKINKIIKKIFFGGFVFLALDEFLQIHEFFGDILGNYFNNKEANNSIFSLNPVFAWLILYFPILLLAMVLWFRIFKKYLLYKDFLILTSIFAYYVFSAYGLEILAWNIWQNRIDASYNIEILLEESGELFSMSLLLSYLLNKIRIKNKYKNKYEKK